MKNSRICGVVLAFVLTLAAVHPALAYPDAFQMQILDGVLAEEPPVQEQILDGVTAEEPPVQEQILDGVTAEEPPVQEQILDSAPTGGTAPAASAAPVWSPALQEQILDGEAQEETESAPVVTVGLYDFAYPFSNSRAGFQYPANYAIPLERYTRVFGDTVSVRRVPWTSSCYGMAVTSCLFYQSGSGVQAADFRADAVQASQLFPGDRSERWGVTLTEFIEAMQLSRQHSAIQNAFARNRNQYDRLCEEIRAFQTTGRNPVVIGVGSGKAESDLVAYRLDESGSETRVAVYDCNYPETERYVTLYKNLWGRYNSWSYQMSASEERGTDYGGDSWISYVPYRDFYQVWRMYAGSASASAGTQAVELNGAADQTAGFRDVPRAFQDAVAWAVQAGVTNGTAPGLFSPNAPCTRNHIVTFLWRASGSPGYTVRNPFRDVDVTKDFGKAAVWAYENGLVNGTTFNGSAVCTRAQAVTYLWKLNGSLTVWNAQTYLNQFSDVSAFASYAPAVAWAVQKGITNGSNGQFLPGQSCTRAQIVTFLYRCYA